MFARSEFCKWHDGTMARKVRDFLNFSKRFPLLFHVISSVFLRNFLNFSTRFSAPRHAISSADFNI